MNWTKLALDEETHTYRYGGKVVPSVTQIISMLCDLSHIDPGVLERKGEIGCAVHKACEIIDLGKTLDPDSIDDAVAPYVDAYRSFLDTVKPQVLAIEQMVYHPTHEYAGRLDRIYRIDGKLVWVDIKTTAKIHPVAGVQTAAYQGAHYGDVPPGSARAVLQLRPDRTFRVKMTTSDSDWQVFLSCLSIYRWRKTNV